MVVQLANHGEPINAKGRYLKEKIREEKADEAQKEIGKYERF